MLRMLGVVQTYEILDSVKFKKAKQMLDLIKKHDRIVKKEFE